MALFLGGWPFFVQAQEGTPPAPPVSVAKPVKREVMDWSEYTGRFEAIKSVEIRARVSGYLQTVNFTDGQYVRKGDLLYVIDPQPYEAAVAKAKANVTRAKSQVNLRRLEAQRGKRLLSSKTISKEAVDTREANLIAAQADLEAAHADLNTAELNLSYTNIKAPVSGKISDTKINVGNLISPSTTLLTTLVSTDPIYFDFDISESDYFKYHDLKEKPESSVQIFVKLLGEKGWPHKGKLDFVDNAFDQRSGTLRLRAVLSNPSDLLVPGVFGRGRLAFGAPHMALLINPQAVLADQDMKLVMIVGEDGVVAPRPVQLGPVVDGLQVVHAGLAETDRIIVSGLLRARPGAKVTPGEVPMAGENMSANTEMQTKNKP